MPDYAVSVTVKYNSKSVISTIKVVSAFDEGDNVSCILAAINDALQKAHKKYGKNKENPGKRSEGKNKSY